MSGARPLQMPSGRRIPRSGQRRTRTRQPAAPAEGPVAKAGAELSALAAVVRACTACGRAGAVPAFGTGFPRAPVFLLKDRPSAAAVASNSAFADEADALAKAFDALGIPLSWTYGTVAVRCGDTDASPEEVRACSSHLLVELEAVSPRVVVAFGEVAVAAVRALDERCGLHVPEELPRGEPVPLRPGLVLLVTEPLPDGVRAQASKRRLWRDLQRLPELL